MLNCLSPGDLSARRPVKLAAARPVLLAWAHSHFEKPAVTTSTPTPRPPQSIEDVTAGLLLRASWIVAALAAAGIVVLLAGSRVLGL